MAEPINWTQAAPRPVALVIMDAEPPIQKGTIVICHRDADGSLYGIRDVWAHPHMELLIVDSWKRKARAAGLKITDSRSEKP